jgi:hypothetical protein
MRRFKIAVSATSASVCILLIAIWIRSGTRADVLRDNPTKSTCIHVVSNRGSLGVRFDWAGATANAIYREWRSVLADPEGYEWGKWESSGDGHSRVVFVFPYWVPVVLTGFVAVAPWLITRFNLRTLIGVVTFWAVVMGIIAYQTRP